MLTPEVIPPTKPSHQAPDFISQDHQEINTSYFLGKKVKKYAERPEKSAEQWETQKSPGHLVRNQDRIDRIRDLLSPDGQSGFSTGKGRPQVLIVNFMFSKVFLIVCTEKCLSC